MLASTIVTVDAGSEAGKRCNGRTAPARSGPAAVRKTRAGKPHEKGGKAGERRTALRRAAARDELPVRGRPARRSTRGPAGVGLLRPAGRPVGLLRPAGRPVGLVRRAGWPVGLLRPWAGAPATGGWSPCAGSDGARGHGRRRRRRAGDGSPGNRGGCGLVGGREGRLCERPFGGSRESHGRRIRRIFAASLDFATHFSA
jgi:hypothetical protein